LTLDELRSQSGVIAEPLAAAAERTGISPNQLTLLSLAFAVAAFLFYFFSSSNASFLYLAALMSLLNAVADLADGALARRTGTADPKGDFLDHVVDRYADMLVLAGIVFAGYAPWSVGFLAVVGVLLTSYIGTQAQALHLGRYYGGMMGRADRMIVIFLATIANAIYPASIDGLPILGWIMVAVMIGSHITALQRLCNIWRRL
jgi:phosphatidylglycerophosphate synthase